MQGGDSELDVLVIGGGLCGTQIAAQLARANRSFVLAEARDQLGGRIRTLHTEEPVTYLDLGPAWVWPHQRHVLTLLKQLGLQTFEQFSQGSLVFQAPSGHVRHVDAATMAGSLRVEGGLQSLIERLAQQVPSNHVSTSARATHLALHKDGVRATFEDGRTLDTRAVALALPPRIAARTIAFSPTLPDATLAAMRGVPTWMAGHAKALALYETPFWRAKGLNGDAMSQRGPLGELHDASPADGSCGALFGFFAFPVERRRKHRPDLPALIREQLAQLYGDEAMLPKLIHIEDWAEDPLVATDDDEVLLREHPPYGPLGKFDGPWAQHLVIAGTEVASREGGYIEGALIAAEEALTKLMQ